MLFALLLGFTVATVAFGDTATWYDYIDGGSCGYGALSNRMIGALSPSHPLYGAEKTQGSAYYKAGSCGMKCKVRCTGPYDRSWQNPCKGGWVTITITDTCPECAPDHIDLSHEAMSAISDISVGGMVAADFICDGSTRPAYGGGGGGGAVQPRRPPRTPKPTRRRRRGGYGQKPGRKVKVPGGVRRSRLIALRQRRAA